MSQIPLEIVTPRLRVRGLRPTDRPAWIDALARSLPLHAPFMPLAEPGVDLAMRFDRQLAAHEAGTSFKGVALAADGRIAAFVNLNEIVRSATMGATAGWSVHIDFAGQGVMTEALTALLDLAFAPEGLALHRVSAGIMPENLASLRVAEKAGFRREGFALKLVKIAGEWRDHVLVAKLAEEHGQRQ
ncbi:hypothetical protein LBMAG42_07520 [Deltaproteobacteria bacterium]|nr:hypothetical protein LBMAG42_07520 [Deltaproteobacteria bacterium]